MQTVGRDLLRAAIASVAVLALAGPAVGSDFSNASSYNTPVGMQPGQDNQPINPSLRDQNGNLTVVNGQFTSSAMAKSFASAGGVATSGSGALFGGASAIGNALNVVTVGNNNTVVVNSSQTNNGNVSATVDLNKHP